MERWIIIGIVVFVVVFVLSAYCTMQLVQGNNPSEDYKLFNKAKKINPSCARWCADLVGEDDGKQRANECLQRVVDTRSCRSVVRHDLVSYYGSESVLEEDVDFELDVIKLNGGNEDEKR